MDQQQEKKASLAMMQFVVDNPPDTEEAMRVACSLHMAVIAALKVKLVFGVPKSELIEEVKMIQKLWETITTQADKLFPDSVPTQEEIAKAREARNEPAPDPLKADRMWQASLEKKFSVTNAAGDKGVHVQVVGDDDKGMICQPVADVPNYGPRAPQPRRPRFVVEGNHTVH
jgi:hypothetical protein